MKHRLRLTPYRAHLGVLPRRTTETQAPRRCPLCSPLHRGRLMDPDEELFLDPDRYDSGQDVTPSRH